MSERPTICLAMIVRDEVATLPGLFASCRDLIDYWVICDTGSTDGTQDLVRRELAGIPGELHEREWVDFGVNRTQCMELSRGKGDYLLILDADTTLDAPTDAFQDLDADSYMLRHIDGATHYLTRRLVRGSLAWRYIGAVHEYIFSDEAETVGRLDQVTIRPRSIGGRRSGRWERDLEILRREVERAPEDPRAQYYLAQTLRDLGRTREDEAILAAALEAYEKRAGMPGWDQETYHAQYQAGLISAWIGQWPRAMDLLIRAWEIRPQRYEALYYLVAGLREREMYRTAHRFASIVADLAPLPIPDDIFFLDPWVYEWGMLFEYSITSYWVGEYRASLGACKRLLSIATLPETYRKYTIENLQHAVREAAQQEALRRERARPATRRIVPSGTSTLRPS